MLIVLKERSKDWAEYGSIDACNFVSPSELTQSVGNASALTFLSAPNKALDE
jgi:hypothetical protein